MPDEIQEPIPQKPKRKYTRREPQQVIQQPAAPNPNLIALEQGIVPLVNQRLEANQKVRMAAAQANQANANLQAAQSELAEIEQEINYRMQLIGQMKNGGMPVPQQPYIAQNLQQGFTPYGADAFPVPPATRGAAFPQTPPSPPYSPVVPFPSMPGPGVGSYPGQNRGLYPDASNPAYNLERDPEKMVNTDDRYQFPPDVLDRINEGRGR